MKRFGEKIQALRERKGLSLRELGKLLEVSGTFVFKLEQGEKTPNASMLLKIAELFEVSLDKLMRDYEEL